MLVQKCLVSQFQTSNAVMIVFWPMATEGVSCMLYRSINLLPRQKLSNLDGPIHELAGNADVIVLMSSCMT